MCRIVSRAIVLLSVLISVAMECEGSQLRAVIVDAVSGMPLSGASVFDCEGKFIATNGADGRLPYVNPDSYPLTIRYIGFAETVVSDVRADSIRMQEYVTELPEVLVGTRRHKVLHMLAYVREYSTLTTYSDTVFLFREKMVDYMLPSEKNRRFAGWRNPRVLSSKSYYRFTNASGLDSVSDRCNQHFSWTDWVGIAPKTELPANLRAMESGTDTLRGKYSATEVWRKSGSRVSLDVNVLADTTSRKWVPNLGAFFRGNVDFEQFRLKLKYDNVAGDSVLPIDLSGYSFNIESNGRGRGMFMFNKADEPFFVSTYGEVYVIDKEYITLKDARAWERRKAGSYDIAIYEPAEAPELQPAVQMLIDRVNGMDHDEIRLGLAPDKRLAGRKVEKVNFGKAVLKRLKGMLGIDHAIGSRKMKKSWRKFTNDRVERNNSRYEDEDDAE